MLTERLTNIHTELTKKLEKTDAEHELLKLIDNLHHAEEHIHSLNMTWKNMSTYTIITPHSDFCSICGRTFKSS